MTGVSDAAMAVGLWTGAILGLVAIVGLMWKCFKFLDKLGKLVNHELRHNGGSSMKDHAKSAAVLSQETLDALTSMKDEFEKHVLEGNMWMLGTERELGSLTSRIKTLEKDDE